MLPTSLESAVLHKHVVRWWIYFNKCCIGFTAHHLPPYHYLNFSSIIFLSNCIIKFLLYIINANVKYFFNGRLNLISFISNLLSDLTLRRSFTLLLFFILIYYFDNNYLFYIQHFCRLTQLLHYNQA